MPKSTFFTLSAITKRISQILQPAIGKSIWVKGEISSGRERGGTFYCDLVETSHTGHIVAKMSCAIWMNDLTKIRNKFKENTIDLQLSNGTYVGFLCSIQYNSHYGLSLKVTDADPAFAMGILELKKNEIISRLKTESLCELNKKKFVPILPRRIGIITSQGSAAYTDFIKTLKSSPFGFKLYLADSTMQGDFTEQQVLSGLSVLEMLDIDLVVIIRGGGSKTDLFSLDNEQIARKIAGYRLPVWTGIGHEIDISVLDYVANRYFKTPTAVAEVIVARFVEMKRHLDEATNRFKSTWSYRTEIEQKYITKAITGIHQGTRKLLDIVKRNLKFTATTLSSKIKDRMSSEMIRIRVKSKSLNSISINRIYNQKQKIIEKKNRLCTDTKRYINENTKRYHIIVVRFKPIRFLQRIKIENKALNKSTMQLNRSFRTIFNLIIQDLTHFTYRLRKEVIMNRLKTEKNSLETKKHTLHAFDPENNLKRGYAMVYTPNNSLVKSINDICEGITVKTKTSDGIFESTIKSIKD